MLLKGIIISTPQIELLFQYKTTVKQRYFIPLFNGIKNQFSLLFL